MFENAKILVGKIVAPQGIRGEVRVQTYTTDPMDLKTLDVHSAAFADGAFKFIRKLNPTSTVIVAHVDGFNDRTSVESLRGAELFIERDSLPELEPGEYYQSDLIGFTVSRDGIMLGTVACFQNFGAGDIIELDNGEMVSFIGADVDMTAKEIKL